MKNSFLYIITLFMLVLFSANTIKIYAEITPMNITLESVSGLKGETIKMPIKISNNTGIIGIEADILVSEGISIEKCELGNDFLENGTLDYNNAISPNKLVWTSSAYQSVVTNGEFAVLYVKIDEDTPEGDYNISIDEKTLEVYNDRLTSVNTSLGAGIITVSKIEQSETTPAETTRAETTRAETTTELLSTTTTTGEYTTTVQCTTISTSSTEKVKGDINNDKTINIFDAVMIKQHLAGIKYISEINVADLNSDTVVSVKDMIIIKNIILDKQKADL